MTPALLGLLFSLATALLVIVGDVALKIAADGTRADAAPMMALGIVLYAASAVLWFLAMRHTSLAQAAVAYAMFSLIALCVIGAIGFGEALGLREVAGIACALSAMALLSHMA